MKKELSIVLSACMSAGLIAGCSGTDSAQTTAATETTVAAETTVQETTVAETTTAEEAETTTEEETEVAEDELKELTYDLADADNSTSFTVDGETIPEGNNYRYDGLGYISANNSSRLLIDYKAQHPDEYWKLMEYTFGESGMHLDLIKIEMGADIDSSSGTEPAVKRSADEVADVTRGAGYQLAADAATLNPDIDIDLIYWGRPAWVADAEDEYEATYQWYKQTIDAIYDTYGLKVTYLTATQNEKASDVNLIKYIAEHLDNETDERYDYGTIKIVAGEGVCTWPIAKKMLNDEDLMNAIDVMSCHYDSWTSSVVDQIKEEDGKQVWFSEGSSPMMYAQTVSDYTGTGSGLSGINGMLDIATRISTAIASGMTMYEFQPAISGYYNGVTYYQKQLIVANSPWSGGFTLDSGFYMTLHFSQFMKKGWEIVPDACYGDGEAGGDGHAVVNSTFNYVTMVDPDTEDTSIVLINNTENTIGYEIDIENLASSDKTFYVWETKDSDNDGDYYANFFKRIGTLTPSDGRLTINLQPYSMVTLSTLDVAVTEYTEPETSSLSLPYSDDFEYSDKDADFLESRGYAPLYTTDEAGAFEVRSTDEGNVLMQIITPDIKPEAWGGTSDPATNLGDDTWSNYTASIRAHFTDNYVDDGKTNYVGFGLRYNLADFVHSGYWIKLCADGTVSLMHDSSEVDSKTIDDLDLSAWHTLSITADGNVITASVDGTELFNYTDTSNMTMSGRLGIYSALQNNYFDDLSVEALDDATEITRMDNFDPEFTYSEGTAEDTGEGWYFNTMGSYKYYNRTASRGYEGATVSFSFTGTTFAILGENSDAVLKVTIDGEEVTEDHTQAGGCRQANYYMSGLSEGAHDVTIEIVSGNFTIDAVEYN